MLDYITKIRFLKTREKKENFDIKIMIFREQGFTMIFLKLMGKKSVVECFGQNP